MTTPAITHGQHFDRGYAARTAGRPYTDHRMNPGSNAITEWQAGWTRADVVLMRAGSMQAEVVKVSPP